MIDNTYTITLLGLGFILGLKHALDADHVVAVSTIVSQVRGLKKSSLIGAIWGVGHTTTLLLVGLVILIFKLVIPNKVALFFEILVGFVLVILGIGVLITETIFMGDRFRPTRTALRQLLLSYILKTGGIG